MDDSISRQAAIDALWKAMYEYEDKMEKQFIESDDHDIEEWILHRIFVQNMSDIDRKAILDLPPAQPEIIHCGDCKYKDDGIDEDGIPFLKCLNGRSYGGTRINDFCSWAERKNDA